MTASPDDIRERRSRRRAQRRARLAARPSASRTSGRTPGGATSATGPRSSPGVVFVLVLLYCLLWPIVSPYDPQRSQLRDRKPGPEPGAPVRHRQVRPRPLHAHGAGWPGLDPDRLRRDAGDPADRGHLRLDLRLRRRPARQRADALPRRALRAARTCRSRSSRSRSSARTNNWTMMIALSIASWFTTARIVRGQVITLKENDYVRAAKAVGARWYRILARHLLPNTLGVLIIAIFLELPAVILGEAFLSFIGLGISPPDASWGAMAQEGRTRLPHPPDRDHRPVGRDRDARALRELHRRRPARRARPEDEGDVAWRCSRSTTCGRTSSPARASCARSTASASRSSAARRSASSASPAAGSP